MADEKPKKPCTACDGQGGWVGYRERREVQEPALGLLPSVQGSWHGMTDRIECPDCEGTGEQTISSLRLSCRFCQGTGYVGGDNEPADELSPPPVHRPRVGRTRGSRAGYLPGVSGHWQGRQSG